MIAITGNILLILGCIISILLIIQPVTSQWLDERLSEKHRCHLTGALVSSQFFCLAAALGVLLYSMVTLNLQLSYVVEHNSVHLPLIYRITGTWGGHEGSLLLWTTIFSGWSLFFWLSSTKLPLKLRQVTLAISAIVSLGFQFLLSLKPPFATVPGVIPDDGRGLNPLLQDLGLAIHPPALYTGYGGISITFALVMAALWLNLLRQWIQSMRNTALVAWGWLTLGIALGSWWAYRELGWGGWWFWDPVENASLMPWLALTALLHVVILSKHNLKAGKAAVALIVSSQALMIIGMFIVRSGVLSSVHSFTSAPVLGFSIISFVLLVAIGGYLSLIVHPPVEPEATMNYQRADYMVLGAIILMVLACGTVLLGTMYPLVMDVLNLGKISVGPAYFNSFFVPLLLATGSLLVFYILNKDSGRLIIFLPAAIVAALFITSHEIAETDLLAITALTIAFMVFAAGMQELFRSGPRPGNFAHIGLALAIAGGTLSERASTLVETRVWPGSQINLGQYTVEFAGTTPVMGPNYVADYGFFEVIQNHQRIGTINPEKRMFPYFGQVLSETDQRTEFQQDIYIALGEPFGDGSWAVRLRVIPYISLLWLGAFFMVFGCCRFTSRIVNILKRLPSYTRHITGSSHNKSGERV